MSDQDLTVQEKFDRLKDIDDTWVLDLINECEQGMQQTQIDDEEIYVEKAVQAPFLSHIDQTEQVPLLTNEVFLPTNQSHGNFLRAEPTTAIERQISQRALQEKTEPSNTNKALQGFWSFFRKNKAFN
jgi:uncharacterized membrane protein